MKNGGQNKSAAFIILFSVYNIYIFSIIYFIHLLNITSSEICALHLTHPSAPTHRAVGSQCCGARGAVGGSVPCSRVSPESRFKPTTSGNKSDALSIRPSIQSIRMCMHCYIYPQYKMYSLLFWSFESLRFFLLLFKNTHLIDQKWQ